MPNVAIVYTDTPTHPIVLTEAHVDYLRSQMRSGEIRWYRSEEEALAERFDADVLFCWGRDTPNALSAHYPNLKWIQSLSAGVEGLEKMDAAKREGVILSKMRAVHGYVMAETTLAYILSFLRDLPVLRAKQFRHEWDKPGLPRLRECCDTTVGIFGIGDIGSAVARLCKLMGMTVLGCRRKSVPMENVDQMYSFENRAEMLRRCDFVVNLVPDTDATKKLIDASFFDEMKSDAVFINIGRGVSVDTDALVEALRGGVIAGAALDVTDPEPLGSDSPLWEMENVIITPHCSADSRNYFQRACHGTLAENLRSYEAGRGVPSAVKY